MNHIVQIIPAPTGLVAVFDDGIGGEFKDPVDVIGLDKDGLVEPLIWFDGYYAGVSQVGNRLLRLERLAG